LNSLSPRPFEGLTPFCNVFLGYGLLALTASNQLASVDLDFRLGHAVNGTDTIVQSSQAQSGPDRASLLLNQPFDYNKTLSSIRSTQASVKTTLKKVPMSSSPISIISPEHLRVIGEIIAQLQSRISAIRAASQAIEHRLDLQVQEFQRQLKLLKDCSGSINSLKSSSTLDSAEKLLETQDQLSARLDGILGALSAEHRPQITEAEKRWFGELEKLRSRVNGGGGFGLLRTRGLMNQARLVSLLLEVLVRR
jgi:nucleoporin NUP82